MAIVNRKGYASRPTLLPERASLRSWWAATNTSKENVPPQPVFLSHARHSMSFGEPGGGTEESGEEKREMMAAITLAVTDMMKEE